MPGLLHRAAAGDTGPALPLYMDMQWQMRCAIAGMCSGLLPRSILGTTGEAGQRLTCQTRTRGANRVVDFTSANTDATDGTEYGLSVRSLEFPMGGGALTGAGCIVTVIEGGNRYEGACGPDAIGPGCQDADPATTCVTPCQITGLTETNELDGPTISGTLACQGLPWTSDLTRLRELTMAGSDPTAPAIFRISACAGL